MPVLLSGRSHHRLHGGSHLLFVSVRHLLHAVSARRHDDRCRGSNHTFGSHIDFLCRHRDERARRERVLVYKRHGVALELVEDADDFARGIDTAAVRLHVEHEQIRLGLHRFLHAAPHEIDERRHDVGTDGQDVNLLRGVGRGLSGKCRSRDDYGGNQTGQQRQQCSHARRL